MICPQCKSKNVYTIDSRDRGNSVRRRRACDDCEHRWSTVEIGMNEYDGIMLVKKGLSLLAGLEGGSDD